MKRVYVVRDKITKANKQLKVRCRSEFPGILFLMGKDRGGSRYMQHEHVKAAMHGYRTINMPNYPSHKGTYETRSGDKQLQAEKNRSISAIVVCECSYSDLVGEVEKVLLCRVYCNKLALVPIKRNFSGSKRWCVDNEA